MNVYCTGLKKPLKMNWLMRVYAYLRASTKEQDMLRAKDALSEFAKNLKVKISAWFIENDSGAKLYNL